MAQGPAWPSGAPALQEYRQTADIGLHLNLTHRFAVDDYVRPLAAWLLTAPLGWVDSNAVRDAFRRQLDLFVKQFGCLPDYLDGHQHVHAFPSVRAVLAEVIIEYWQGAQRPWVRAPDQLIDDGYMPFKAWVLRSATRGFSNALATAGLQHNAGFAGLYALTPQSNFPALMQRWLKDLPSQTLIMVHPGEASDDADDPISATRSVELAYLSSSDFAQQLLINEVRLSRLSFTD
jgi:predicted glycoside hydrolase/deacetylase ChbG (UPF0249 family)